MNLSGLLSDVFDRGADERLDVEDEKALLVAAKLGDETAKARLLIAYGPAIRSGVAWYVRSLATAPRREDLDDVRSQAVVGVLEAIEAHDPERSDRLAGIVASYVRNALATMAGDSAQLTIPERTLKRFSGILREAEGDVAKALELAPSHEMKPETFLAVLDAVRNVESLDGRLESFGDGTAAAWGKGDFAAGGSKDVGTHGASSITPGADAVADVEDRILVEAALKAVDDVERNVVALAYGFAEYDTLPDAEIGARMGLSRAKVQRTRSGALGKMRSALGVA